MNPDFPQTPRQAMEASLTALLLGELPPEQADALRQAIAHDPELARLCERLKRTIEFVRETEAAPVAQPTAPSATIQLSEQRRQKLLQQFKTVAPQEFAQPSSRRKGSLLPLSIAASLVALLAVALFLPALSRSKSRSMASWSASSASSWYAKDSTASADMESLARMPQQKPALPSGGRIEGPARGVANSKVRANNIELPSLGAVPQITAGQASAQSQWSVSTTLRGFYDDDAGRTPAPSDPATGLPVADGFTLNVQADDSSVAYGFQPVAPAQQSAFRRRYGLAGSESATKAPVAGDAVVAGRVFETSAAAPKVSKPVTLGLLPSASAPEPEVKVPATSLGFAWKGVEVAKDREELSDGVSLELRRDLKRPVRTERYAVGLPPSEGEREKLEARKNVEKVSPGASVDKLANTAAVPVVNGAPALVQDGKLLFEMGKLDDAEAKLKEAVKENPAYQAGYSYLNQIAEARYKEAMDKGDVLSRQGLVEIKQALAAQPKRELLPAPKPVAAPTSAQERDDSERHYKFAFPPPVPQPEVPTRGNAFSTFSLNVSDVSFKLAAASLEKGVMPEPATVRSEEFLNAFDYRDPEPPAGVPVAFAWERARYPFAQNRDLLRFSLKTAAQGRQAGRSLNIVLLLDNSGSMERADRVRIIQEALRVLAAQLQPQDKLSVVTFARTARLWVDGVPGNQAGPAVANVSSLTPQGGTNLEEAMNLAYQTALRHYLANGINRVVLLTDGAANLGNVEPSALKKKVEDHRKQGVAFDCFGIGWEGYNDDLLELLARNGDGRYGFINTPEEASAQFAGQLAGALRVAASDVKVQVEFNPNRVTAYRQIGYAKHQLTKEQFRDNTVDAAEIGAAESGNALYVIAVNPQGEGPLATVRVRYKVPGTAEYREQEWMVSYTGTPTALDQASAPMRLGATASAFSEWLVSSPYCAEVTPDRLLSLLNGVPEVYGADARPRKLEWMIRQAKSLSH